MWRFFFFSSRRRHTRFDCDWSSDVCSSDLAREPGQDLVGRDPFVAQVLAQHVGGDELTTRELGVRRSRLLIRGLQCLSWGVLLWCDAADDFRMFRCFAAQYFRSFVAWCRYIIV